MVTGRVYRRFGLIFVVVVVSFLLYRLSIHRPVPHGVDNPAEGRVKWVVDGDTIILEDGRKVRYAGIDTP